MTRGEGEAAKVHYKGQEEDFIVFVESLDDLKKWKSDKSVPLASVLQSFKIFVTHSQGAQGQLGAASKATIENEFGSKNEDDALAKILEEGTLQVTESSGRGGPRNETQGGRQAH